MTDHIDLAGLTARLALTDAYATAVRNAIAAARSEGLFTPEPPLDLYAYRHAVDLWRADPPIAALLAAALYRADGGNAALIRACWPTLAATVQARYDAPGGRLPHEHAGRTP